MSERHIPKPTDRCAKCGYTYDGHIGNLGHLYPCWTPRPEDMATPTPARSEAEWGEPKPDCPRCQGAGTYRSLAWGGLRPCPCGLSEPARSEAAGGEGVDLERVDDFVVGLLDAQSRGGPRADWYARLSDYLRELRAALVFARHDIASLRQQLAAAERERNALHGELADVGASIRTTEFMDPPDGGDVSLAEQVRRMRAALDESRQQLAAAREASDLTGCCVECGRPPEITVAHVNGVRCVAAHPRCACAAGLHLWPAARTEPAREGEGGENG